MKKGYAVRSVEGERRARSEDRYQVRPDLGLVAIADGVASRPHGEHAAALAVAAFAMHVSFNRHRLRNVDLACALVRESFEVATEAIVDASRADARFARMSTTLSAGVVVAGHAVIGSVGDSRVYRIRSSSVEQLTPDHILHRMGIGDSDVEPHVVTEPLAHGDALLFCTNGLSDVVPSARIGDLVGAAVDFECACDAVVAEARAAGADDDLTVILVDASGVSDD